MFYEATSLLSLVIVRAAAYGDARTSTSLIGQRECQALGMSGTCCNFENVYTVQYITHYIHT